MRGGRAPLGAAAVAAIALLLGAGCNLAPIDLDSARPLPLRSTIVASDGTMLARLFRQNRALMKIQDMPPWLVDAVIAAEDARFFEHPGYDLRSIARAALENLRSGEIVQGGSTITQQYVKNTYFIDPDRSLARKARELRLAIEVEKLYSKAEILERYLNTVYLGQGAYGVKAAAETYFGHGVQAMTLPEAALLAAIIKAPSYYDPREHPKRARDRRDYVLGRMAELGDISRVERRDAAREPVGVMPDPPRIATREPYFVEAVKRELMRTPELGVDEIERARMMWTGGIRVETTLDPDLQTAAVDAVDSVLNQPGDPSAALVAIDPDMGEIVAMVAGRDWEASQVNLALGRAGGGSGRQPGSAFKPIVAATALEAGMSFDTEFDSAPASFLLDDGTTWNVANSEGGHSGSMPLDEALIHSVNGVYARLALELGAGAIVTEAELLGVRSKLPAYPSIALGSAEVSVLDMAAAYATFANGGTAIAPTTIRSVHLSTGESLKPHQETVEGAVSPATAYLLSEVLQQVIERGTGTAAAIGRPAAGKTGTTNDFADAWFVGYTPDLVAAVWVGYPQGRVPMNSVHGIRVYGGTFPALIWKSFMAAAHEGLPVRDFHVPRSETVTVEIDPLSGLLAAPWCPGHPVTMLRVEAPTETCPAPAPDPTPSPSGDKSRPPRTPEPDRSPEPTPSPTPTPRDDGGKSD